MMLSRLFVAATVLVSAVSVSAIERFTVQASVDPIPTPDQYTHWETKFYTQTIDHFNFQVNSELNVKTTTYQQRYLINDTYWLQGNREGPIFLYAGNEGDITLFAQNSGFMWDIAPEFGALLIFPEHRYYGQSYPFPDHKNDTRYMQYLTAEQALADYAVMITDFKKNVWNTTNEVIVFGGSYGGMLAAWMRIKYPHVVAGAIAASAPIWQFDGLVDPREFNRIVTRTFHNANEHCDVGIYRSWSIIKDMTTHAAGRQQLQDIFHLCDPVSLFDAGSIIKWIADNLNSLAMGDYPYPSTFLGPMPANPVNYACNQFAPDQTDIQTLKALFHVQHTAIDYTNQSTCYSLNVTGPPTLAADNGWNYQSCTEMVMPIGQYGRDPVTGVLIDMFDPMPWNTTIAVELCKVGNPGVTPQPQWIPTNFASSYEQLSQSSNIFFSNGNLDPWSGGGVLQNVSDTVVSYYIIGGAHHLDLRGTNPLDPDTVKFVREVEKQYIRQFIANPSSSDDGIPKKWYAIIATFVTLAIVAVLLLGKHFCIDEKQKPVAVNADYQPIDA